jgi:hypothetical protein
MTGPLSLIKRRRNQEETSQPARRYLREICVDELCIVLHGDANQATDAPVTG